MTNYHVLVTDPLHPASLELLSQAEGITFTAPGQMDRAAALMHIPQAHALIIRSSTRVDCELIDAGAKLKVICRAGIGVDNVDVAAATARGIVVMNAPDGSTVAAAELTLGFMLALARHIGPASASVGAGQWDRKAFQGTELRGKTLGIVGLGRVGRMVARRAAAFEMRVIAFDPYLSAEDFARQGVGRVAWEELLAQADYITLHVPLTAETRHLVNTEALAVMKDGVRIINTARGGLVDESALAQAVQSGRVAGVAIDVYSAEPPRDNSLVGLSGVVHTPHLGASTDEAQAAVAAQAVGQVLDALTAGDYRNVVNSEALGR